MRGGYRSCGGCGSFESGVEISFEVRIRQEGPRVGNEAGGLGEGGPARVVGVAAVQQVGGAAIERLDEGRVAGDWDGGVEAKDGVGIGIPAREARALGRAEGGGTDQEDVKARGAWVDGKGLLDE